VTKEHSVSSLADNQTAPTLEPAQHFGTEGIKPLARASFISRLFMRVVERRSFSLAAQDVGLPRSTATWWT